MAKTVNDIPRGATAVVTKGTITRGVPGSHYRKYCRITGDTSYPTGGYPLTASDFNLTRLDHVKIINSGSGDPLTAPANLAWFYDTVAQKLKLQVVSTGAELAAAQDASACTCDIEVEGL